MSSVIYVEESILDAKVYDFFFRVQACFQKCDRALKQGIPAPGMVLGGSILNTLENLTFLNRGNMLQ